LHDLSLGTSIPLQPPAPCVRQGTGTLATESYTVLKKVNMLGWFIIDTLAGLKDRRSDLRYGMTTSLERIAQIVE
jgi:hypothetical protein